MREGWSDVDAAHMHEVLKNNNNKKGHLSKSDLKGKAIPPIKLKTHNLDITVKFSKEKSKNLTLEKINQPTSFFFLKKCFNHFFHRLFQGIYLFYHLILITTQIFPLVFGIKI